MTHHVAVSLTDVSSYLPQNKVGADWFAQYAESDALASNIMFRAPTFRHHIAPGETATDMIECAAAGIVSRHGLEKVRRADVLITHSQLPDSPIVGCAANVAHRLGMKPEWVIDIHNGGCASFVLMMKLARQILSTTSARTAIIANAQNSAGQIFVQEHVRGLAQAPIPGDGAGVGLLEVTDQSPILDIETRTYGEFAGDMVAVSSPTRKYWEAGTGEMHVGFNESKITKVLARGNRQVPEVASAVCSRLGLPTSDLDILITNQPNRAFLRNWRDALEVPTERHPDSFDDCGNLFGAGIPVTLDRSLDDGTITPGDVVMLAAFAHAGDFAGAAAVRWGGPSR